MVSGDAMESMAGMPLLVRLRMPGCYITGRDAAAERYFKLAANDSLDPEGGKRVICHVLGAPHAYLARFCPLELAYEELTFGRRPRPDLVGFHFDQHQHLNRPREYALFLMSASSNGESGTEFTLRPLSAGIKLLVESSPGKLDSDSSPLDPLPESITVRLEALEYSRVLSVRDLGSDCDELKAMRQFFGEILSILPTTSPSEAWSRVREKHPNLAEGVPDWEASLFDEKLGASRERIEQEVKEMWRHPVDALALVTRVYADIRDALRRNGKMKETMLRIDGVAEWLDSGSTSFLPTFGDSLRRMPWERRMLLRRIHRLRNEIGPVDFDVVKEIRELRENGPMPRA